MDFFYIQSDQVQSSFLKFDCLLKRHNYLFVTQLDLNQIMFYMGHANEEYTCMSIEILRQTRALFSHGKNRSAGARVLFKLAFYMHRSIFYSSALIAHRRF